MLVVHLPIRRPYLADRLNRRIPLFPICYLYGRQAQQSTAAEECISHSIKNTIKVKLVQWCGWGAGGGCCHNILFCLKKQICSRSFNYPQRISLSENDVEQEVLPFLFAKIINKAADYEHLNGNTTAVPTRDREMSSSCLRQNCDSLET